MFWIAQDTGPASLVAVCTVISNSESPKPSQKSIAGKPGEEKTEHEQCEFDKVGLRI